MADLLVSLLRLPDLDPALQVASARGIEIRRAIVPEKHLVTRGVAQHFSEAWASECEVAFARQPVACFLAVDRGSLCGFAAYEATCRNFFGPLGVGSEFRGWGLGKALLLRALQAMREEGYVYAVIGGAGPVDFFQRTVSAVEIGDSTPGVYRGLLRGAGA